MRLSRIRQSRIKPCATLCVVSKSEAVQGPEVLTKSHDVAGFSCEDEGIARWVRESARESDASGRSRTHVFVAGGRVVAFFSLICAWWIADEAPRRATGGSRQSLPAILIGKLARDRSLKGTGAGGEVLAAALKTALRVVALAGVRVVVVDAASRPAQDLYEKYGFTAVGQPGFPRRLYLLMSTLRKGNGDSE